MSARWKNLVWVLLAAGLFALPAQAFEYASNEGAYTVNFPAPPSETVRDIGPNKLIAHAMRAGDVIYVAAHGDFVDKIEPDVEMNANIDNYAKEVHAKVTSKLPFTMQRGERTLEGIQFVYDGERSEGKGIVVVDGTSSYLVAASTIKPAHDEAAVNAFLNSFRLEPKK